MGCGCRSILQKWLVLTSRLRGWVNKSLGDLGCISARRPWTTLAICLAIALACCSGFARINVVTDTAALWTDQTSNAFLNRRWVAENFGENPAITRFVIQSKDRGQNALTVAAFRDAFAIVDEVYKVGSDGSRFGDLCQRLSDGGCLVDGPLRFFGANETSFNEEVSSQADLLRILSRQTYPQGNPVMRSDIYGGLQTSADGSTVESAPVWRVDFVLRGGLNMDRVKAWQSAVVELHIADSESVSQRFESIHVEVFTSETSLDDELTRSVSADVALLGAGFAFLLLACAMMLGHPLRGVGGRRVLGTCEFFLVLVATAAGYGISIALGFAFTTLQLILPFILVGIGVDSAFVITDAYDRTDKAKPVEERVREAMHHEGMSITLTSFTSMLSFAVGTSASFPAVTSFCVYAMFSMLFIYTFHLTAYCALLSVSAQRMAAGRVDCFVCIKVKVAEREEENEGCLQRLMIKYARAITSHIAVKLTILLVFVSFTAFCAYMTVAKTTTEFDVLDVVPDESYVRAFLSAEEGYFGGTTFTLSVPVTLHIRNVDQGDARIQEAIRRAEDEFVELNPLQGPLQSWHRSFTAWAVANKGNDTRLPADQFQTVNGHEFLAGNQFHVALQSWLDDSSLGGRFATEVVWAGHRVLHSRMTAWQKTLTSSIQQADALRTVEEWYEGKDSELPGIFVHAESYIFYHQYQIIQRELFLTIAGCFLAVLIISLIVLAHPKAMLIVMTVLVMVFVDLMGAIPISSLDLNSISMINLVMAIGLVVDYSMHIANSFMAHDSSLSRDERVVLAMAELGVSVIKGLLSTAIAIIPLAFAGSQVFRVFFIMFAWILGAGGLHGLVLLPVILSLVGPAKLVDHSKGMDAKVQDQVAENGVEGQADFAPADGEASPEVEVDLRV
jgi:predicted RND superfamily exporter protein